MKSKISYINDSFRISTESFDKGWNMPLAHHHLSYEIYVLTKGNRVVTIDDTEYPTPLNSAALFKPNIGHKSRGSSAFSGICIHFSEQYLDLIFKQDAKNSLLRCFSQPVLLLNEEQVKTIQNIAENFEVFHSGNFIKLSIILDILNHSKSIDNISMPEKQTITEQVIRYVSTNYTNIQSVSDIADNFRISENYIYKIFQTNFNKTPKQYINELRIDNACYSFRRENTSIKAIANNCGFSCYEHFSRVFKSIKGESPSTYKKNILNINKD